MKLRKNNSYIFRVGSVYLAVALLFFVCGARLVQVNIDNPQPASANQGRYSLNVYRHSGTVFDRKLNPLTNIPGGITALCVATPQAVTSLKSALGEQDFQSALERMNGGKPILLEINTQLIANGITNIKTHRRYSGLAPHIIGYLDGSGHGKTGILADWDSELYSEDKTTATYQTDALGRVLAGIEPIIDGQENSAILSGVALTIDRDIQQIVQEETAELGSGAAVVLQVGTGKILAIHSLPFFDQDDPASALDKPDSPFMNKALSGYNVGSVFKSVVAAAALESGIPSETRFTCNGSLDVGGVNFVCNRAEGHGEMDMSSALAHSCNVYFYNLALMTDATQLIETAKKLGLGDGFALSRSITNSAGTLPFAETLSQSPAAVANFAIGQGDVMLSPLSIAAAYATIANGGIYMRPSLIEGTVLSQKLISAEPSESHQVLHPDTCKKLMEALNLAVTDGTGTKAQPKYSAAAGKTATAQTGWEKDGRSVLISWFAGIFPAESPEYVIVVTKEDGTSGSNDCAPIFKRIADRLQLLA